MIHYFGAFAGLAAPLLVATAASGLLALSPHVPLGLITAILVVGTHSTLILFMVVTGRVVREAMRTRPLGAEYLAELNAFFASKAGYPAALFGSLSIVVAAVLGYAERGFGLSSVFHLLAGVTALVVNLWAFTVEWRALSANQVLVDDVARRLDEIDREHAAGAAIEPLGPPFTWRRLGFSVAFGAWLPYLYILLIVWKGDASRVSVHPWLELSAVGLVTWCLAIRCQTLSHRR